MKYGINYRGSKNAIVADIIKTIIMTTGYSFDDSAVTFYDLFGGGFGVSHYVLSHTRWKVVYNEPFNFIADFIEEFLINKRPVPYDFVSRETFKRATELTEPTEEFPAWRIGFIRSTFSFGGNLRSYIYGADIENKKRDWHNDILKTTDYLFAPLSEKKKNTPRIPER